ncbi:carboxylyase-like protein [Thermogladius calderae 1633]|uniref:Anhydromevalonate phosphate decarboxylase n=1 Tax=Thermogladius calderae (strain DSM 22663 / VKM B-2946 / 1633) TaxID=1184251 RepID=I3TCR3_THEC1|nr:UbiD family decarboxylase domain-containing protein [Thermogladius calderae]AFK50551.1 carboxylyase-like protein [Thermogladius calderae 1633]
MSVEGVYLTTLASLVDSLKGRKDTFFAGDLDPEYEPTRAVYGHRRERVVFRLKGKEWECVSNILRDRGDVYELVGARSDSELYEKLLRAYYSPSQLEVVDFAGSFRRADMALRDLPFIKFYREDGGPYLTSAVFIACWEGVCNSSFHRVMYIDDDRATLRIVPRHLHYMVKKAFEAGRDLPVAMVLGLDVYQEIAAAMSPPYGVFEVGIGAALSGVNRVAKTPLFNIPVPVTASLVVEGVISREEDWEGPFVDILSLVDERRRQNVFKPVAYYVNAQGRLVYHAIVPATSDHFYLMGLPREPLIYESVKKVAPGVRAVRLAVGGGSWLIGVIAIEQSTRGEALSAALAALTAHPSMKVVVVVDEDIDVDDPLQVEWAIATRSKPGEDVVVLRNAKASTLDPRSPEGVGDKLIVIATKPFNEPWSKYRRAGVP